MRHRIRFFHDGMYRVHSRDTYVLRVPVRYYREPPTCFTGWRTDAPPRWGEHWGHDWHNRHDGWDQWNRHSVPKAAPLPVDRREYAGKVYPNAADQQGKHDKGGQGRK